MAPQTIAEQAGARRVSRRAPKRSERLVYWLSHHWLLVFNIAWSAFVIAPWLAPVFMKIGATGLGGGVYWVYQFFCHQLPERSFFLFGSQPMYSLQQINTVWPGNDPNVLRQFVGDADFGWKVAYSDRMVSMYTAFWLASMGYAVLRRRVPPLPIWGYLLLILPMALDGGSHFVSDVMAGANFGTGFRDTNAWLQQLTGSALPISFYVGDAVGSFNSWMRLLTGTLFGIASVWLAFPYADAAFNEVREELDEKFKRLSPAASYSVGK
jgi:uncharacterized membrane protein